jgi:hypothetical protein
MVTAALMSLSQRRSDKIASEDEPDYECTFFDSCEQMGEKIRDLAIGIAVRFDQLDTSSPRYPGHAEIWARQKNILNKCIQKFQEKGCGDGNMPPGFPMRDAVAEAGRASKPISSGGDIVRRGGLIFPVLIICTLSFGLCVPAARAVRGRVPATAPAR